MLKIEPIYQRTDSDCGIACLQMVLTYFDANKRGISALSTAIDGLQVRTLESYLRERGFCVISGNLNMKLLKYAVKLNMPAICLTEEHYVVVKGFEGRSIIYNCPKNGEIKESTYSFNKRWHNYSDDAVLYNWGIIANA